MFEYDNTHVLNVNMKVTIIPCFLDFIKTSTIRVIHTLYRRELCNIITV